MDADEGSGVQIVSRDGVPHLSFRFPDTDGVILGPADDLTLAGPAKIVVTDGVPPGGLPCAVANTPCAGQTELVACIDDFFANDGACGRAVAHPTFKHFTALPPPNDYQADCFAGSPPCTASASPPQVRAALDRAGNLLVPVAWQGVLVRDENIPVPRLVRARVRSPLPLEVPDSVFLASFTPAGGRLPPIFEPQLDPDAPDPDTVTIFGSADAPYSILRVARRHGTCNGGPNRGKLCADETDCARGVCELSRVGNPSKVCANDEDCGVYEPCGALFDFAKAALGGGGLFVLDRQATGFCDADGLTPCTSNAECLPTSQCVPAGFCQDDLVSLPPGEPINECMNDTPCTGSICVAYGLEAQSPVPLEGLAASEVARTFTFRESLDLKDRNGDGDAKDSVVTLRARATGLPEPLGAPAGCGLADADGRAVVRISQPPFSFPAVSVEDDVVAFLESESQENECYVNVDADSSDAIVRVFKLGVGELLIAPPAPAPAVDAAPKIDGKSLAISRDLVFFRAMEAAQGETITTRISVRSDGEESTTGDSIIRTTRSMTPDGRFVVFESTANDLDLGFNDSNGAADVFVHHRDTDADGIFDEPGAISTTLASRDWMDEQSDGPSTYAAISANGRYLEFETLATDLVDDDANGVSDIIVRDLLTETNVRASLAWNGAEANGNSFAHDIADGRFVVFTGHADNLVQGDTNTTFEILRDRDTDADGIFDEAGAVATERVAVKSGEPRPSMPATIRRSPTTAASWRSSRLAPTWCPPETCLVGTMSSYGTGPPTPLSASASAPKVSETMPKRRIR